MTIQNKLNLALAGILLLVLVIAVRVSMQSEQEISDTMVHDLLHDKASGYLDSMNMLMVSGAIKNRELLREKLLSDKRILEARMIRAPRIDSLYGKGLDHEYPKDELDHRALAGESLSVEKNGPDGRSITYVTPVVASSNYRGTNCLLCHQAKEGEVIGATRITYSMNEIDQQINSNMIELASLQGGMMLAALVILSLLLRKLIVSPTHKMQRTLTQIEESSDLTLQLDASSTDEIGQTAKTLNHMLNRIANSLKAVASSSGQVETSASNILTSAEQARQAAEKQRAETSQILHGIDDLMSSTATVTDNARASSQSALEARQVANDGMSKTSVAVDHIMAMKDSILETSGVIGSLDERSNNVGSVLVVIKEIAEQTNLLALNAAIEAARAGESGRGFAVVADEVRTLSQRTHDSAREIESMIAQLQTEAQKAVGTMHTARETAEEGVSRIQDAAEALNLTIERMDQMTQLSQSTLADMEQQVRISEQLSSSIHRISRESEATVGSADSTCNTANELQVLSQQLNALIRQFRL
ncbi:methyl-accepting chemotaxis protein [Oceanobacter mangrovi]|uniref:methyl-accepting chemotaxis protein n=1 Tax=Oceanobacter mangrovi TaxID=2862510 RepID=UPI001C8F0E68|nr:methyl-accepting chemotaxis protein [Oceanobacter mangrovi]